MYFEFEIEEKIFDSRVISNFANQCHYFILYEMFLTLCLIT